MRAAAARRPSRVPTAAVVYDAEVLPAGSIPAESFDRKVSAALTPGGVLRLQPWPRGPRGRGDRIGTQALRLLRDGFTPDSRGGRS